MNCFSTDKFDQMPIVGILRGVDLKTIDRLLPLYESCGFTTIEITMNTPNVEALIRHVRNTHPQLNVGAGTVCDMGDLKKALDAGSQFIVTPILDEEVIQYCKQSNIPVFPGAMTPTEIYKAWKAGASAVKIFPFTQFKVGYIKDVKAPLNEIKLLPTGGVSKDNIASFFEAGAHGVGMGGSLFPKHLMAEGKEEEMRAHLLALKEAYEVTLVH
ncbi:bifunctional 4-hydroxy-2-oxoglutarate aldolase/2-dehydro-3-deoxy-phosphogluconate aldolase [Flammeovirga pacifica]|uniref:2-dehydro-3-deoxyphosphogluconate aldolase n=1 Tax=Flammeovirga pacifica TaxID=915059 RepID=A0A1S1YS76_FLAPC|nr:bifunctional 4-hydroxy-2-oxoglutarate aldolase/2-dehydro-3-deoxy-phosphogluconate aldolase [Flammeovirga pacifica]OHX63882.1 2-dehydro-3-deoxyphosphogluconate aldolase [Flammeovirga pacifica]